MKLLTFVISIATLAASCKPREFNSANTSDIKDNSQLSDAQLARLPKCDFLKDVFEPRAKFPVGSPKAGLCVDTRFARNLILQTPETSRKFTSFEASQQLQPMTYVANVSHLDNFYLAAIPSGNDDVERVIFHEESFPAPVPAAHGQIRLDFKRDVLLIPQIPGAGAPFATKHLILSFEALGEPGWKFDLVKGLQGQFAGVWRIKTLQDFAVRMSKTSPQHETQQFLLAFENYPKQRLAILQEWIKRSTENKLNHMYNTFTSSCAMEALNVIESVRNANSECEVKDSKQVNFLARVGQNLLQRIDNRVATPMEVYPTFAETALKARSLLKEKLPNLDADPLYFHLIK